MLVVGALSALGEPDYRLVGKALRHRRAPGAILAPSVTRTYPHYAGLASQIIGLTAVPTFPAHHKTKSC